MRELILRFRELCLERYPDDIDPVSRERREERFETTLPDDYVHLLGWRSDSINISRALAMIARTPRTLKAIFRRVWEMWQALHGEVDFDDLLVATTLRLGAPQTFEFLQSQIGNIRAREFAEPPRPAFDSNDPLGRYLEQEWERAIKDTDFNHAAARKLVEFLMPRWEKRDARTSPQGVQNWHPTDYWERMLREKLEPGEIRDQSVLRAIDDWLKRDDNHRRERLELIRALYSDERFTEIFEHFGMEKLEAYEVRSLASLLLHAVLEGKGVAAHAESTPGFLALWRLATRKPIAQEAHQKWVVEELAKASTVSLRFANDVYYYWRYNQFDSKREAVRRLDGAIRKQYIELVRSYLGEWPQQLARILDPSYIYSSYHFAILFSSPSEGGPGFDGREWRWFGNLLLEAAELEPQVVVPQLAPVLVTEDRERGSFVYSVNREIASGMFGSYLSRLVTVLRSSIDISQFDERDRGLIRYAQRLSLEDLKAE